MDITTNCPRLAKIPTLGYRTVILVPLEGLQENDVFVYSVTSRNTPWIVESPIDKSGNVSCRSLLSGLRKKINQKRLRKNKVYKVRNQ